MSVAFTLDDAELRAALRRIIGRLQEPRDVLDALGQAVQEHIAESFDTESDPHGRPWAPLSPVTLARRRGDSAQILRDNSLLMNSITRQVSDTAVTVGTKKPYATTHQFGAKKGAFGTYVGKGFGGSTPTISIPWGDIPARPFIPGPELPDTLRDDLLDVLSAYLEAAAQ